MISLPKISLITPSFNQAKFIRYAVESVLSQEYPNLEYMVMDGGSTDGTLEILKKYRGKLIWFSQKDRGQTHAINLGLRKATGEIVGYLNSDDYLEKGSLYTIGEYFARDKNVSWLTGKCYIIDEKNRKVEKLITLYKNFFLKFARKQSLFYITQFISQPATFWRRELIREIGYFDETLSYSMDYDYWLRLWKTQEPSFIDSYLASFRVHRKSKTYLSPKNSFQEAFLVSQRYTNSRFFLFLHRVHDYLSLLVYRIIR